MGSRRIAMMGNSVSYEVLPTVSGRGVRLLLSSSEPTASWRVEVWFDGRGMRELIDDLELMDSLGGTFPGIPVGEVA